MAIIKLERTVNFVNEDERFNSTIQAMAELDKFIHCYDNIERLTDMNCTRYCDLETKEESIQVTCTAIKFN